MAHVMSARMATLHELDTVYSSADLHRMYEVIVVNAYNQAQMAALSQDA